MFGRPQHVVGGISRFLEVIISCIYRDIESSVGGETISKSAMSFKFGKWEFVSCNIILLYIDSLRAFRSERFCSISLSC
jgi:hypothetical protein